MAKVMDKNGRVQKPFEKDIETIIAGKNGFIAKYALQHTGNDFFKTAERQNWLWNTYLKTGYAMQIAILKKMDGLSLQESVAVRLKESLANANDEQTKLINSILKKL